MLPVLRHGPFFGPSASGTVNRLESFFDRTLNDLGSWGRAWDDLPVAVWEDEDHLYIEAELPGVAESDVEMTFHNGMLFIRGERKPEEGRRYLYNGRTYGRFEQVITLPTPVQVEQSQAKLADGVLRVTLPKSPEARPRRLTIQGS